MYRLTNVPHAKNERAQLVETVENQTVYVKVIDPKVSPPFNASGVCDLYIGDHMFAPAMQDDLRKMVGRALVSAIEMARDIGYRWGIRHGSEENALAQAQTEDGPLRCV